MDTLVEIYAGNADMGKVIPTMLTMALAKVHAGGHSQLARTPVANHAIRVPCVGLVTWPVMCVVDTAGVQINAVSRVLHVQSHVGGGASTKSDAICRVLCLVLISLAV